MYSTVLVRIQSIERHIGAKLLQAETFLVRPGTDRPQSVRKGNA